MAVNYLYIFTNDLRTSYLPELANLSDKVNKEANSTLYCAYFFDLAQLSPSYLGQSSIDSFRLKFLIETLEDLNTQLSKLGIPLLILTDNSERSLKSLITKNNISHVAINCAPGSDEKRFRDSIKALDIEVCQYYQSSLYNLEQLPFSLNQLPDTFTQFRKKVEAAVKVKLPPNNSNVANLSGNNPVNSKQCKDASLQSFISKAQLQPNLILQDWQNTYFYGGEMAAQRHCKQYFSLVSPSTYKETRNSLDNWNASTKFSPWLANGSICPKDVWQKVEDYEALYGANESTYWIKFELLWREYFYWYALKHKNNLFNFSGISAKKPLTSFYPERFSKWCNGNTPNRFINAIMNQLNATGYISNRARQLTASYFVNELQLDWRYGAAYFQRKLIDYDVASNWGNWQYLAGVGCDPRGPRHFNTEKQQQIYDPEGTFIKKWGTNTMPASLDSNDIVDWPVLN